MLQLQARREVWENGFLPLHALCPLVTSEASLQQLHGLLLAHSKLTPTHQMEISGADMQQVLELTSTQADVLREVLASLSVLNTGPSGRAVPGSEAVFVHELSLFLFAQLFSKESQRPDVNEVWVDNAAASTAAMAMDGMLSPTRAMSVRTAYSGKTALRMQLQQHLRQHNQQMRMYGDYLRRNLRTLMDLVADNPTPTPAAATGGSANGLHTAQQACLTATQVDRLNFLMHPTSPRHGLPVSALVPGLSAGPVPTDVVTAALRQLWQDDLVLESPRCTALSPASTGGMLSSPLPRQATRHAGASSTSGQMDDGLITGVMKGTVVRGEQDSPRGMLRITDCHDSILYILTPLQCVYITGCSECTIVLGAVGTMTRMERCDKIQLMAASTRVVVSSCHECVLHLGTARPPTLLGDCRCVKLAPFNTRYERQLAHIKAAGIRLDIPNRWDSPLVLQAKERRYPGLGGGLDSPRASPASAMCKSAMPSSNMFSLLPPDEFLPYVIPFQGSHGPLAGGPAPSSTTAWRQQATVLSRHPGLQQQQQQQGGTQPATAAMMYMFPLPLEYERSLARKLGITADLRHKLRQAGLGKEREVELNNAIQAHFKEWLASSGALRQIYDLSNLERLDEFDMGQGLAAPALHAMAAQKERASLSL